MADAFTSGTISFASGAITEVFTVIPTVGSSGKVFWSVYLPLIMFPTNVGDNYVVEMLIDGSTVYSAFQSAPQETGQSIESFFSWSRGFPGLPAGSHTFDVKIQYSASSTPPSNATVDLGATISVIPVA
jgi:hypothetical protein